MRTVTDFHSHILPGIDDGSSCVEESIELLQLEASQGIRHVIATPHFYPRHDSPEAFLKRRARAEAELREEMENYSGLPDMDVGAEVYFFPGMSDSDILSQLTISNKRCILIEMEAAPWSQSVYRELEQIWLKWGITPIIAHLDRYIGRFRTYQIPERLADLPVLVQVNASFFLQGSTAGMAMRMLRSDQIQLLGSDCHNVTSRRPNLGPALEKIERRLGREAIDRICSYESEILNV